MEPDLHCRLLDDDPALIVRRHLADPSIGWSVGTYGAIAEFQYDAGEPRLCAPPMVTSPSLSTKPGTIARPSRSIVP